MNPWVKRVTFEASAFDQEGGPTAGERKRRVSLNQWIAAAVAEKVGVVETAAEFFKQRAGKATGAGMMKYLRTAPRMMPEGEDEIR